MGRPFHIAVLECDTPVDAVKEKRGTYGAIFQQLLIEGFETLGKADRDLQLRVTQWDVVQSGNYPDLEKQNVDAILVSGSKHTSFHNDKWILKLVAYVQTLLQNFKIPLIGICFGHQIIGRALGAEVGFNPGGWEISAHDIDLSEEGSKLLGTKSIVLHQMHRDALLTLPEGAFNLGCSDRCSIQGMIVPGKAISFQAHPEFDEFIMERIIETRRAQGVFADEFAIEGLARAARKHDGVRVCAAILKYVLAFSD
ncbi:class I glutamine amidotransferase-like protein [Phaeosphaeriaceae sp. PMI808]|nr:class I glutamine amidotransferase-like protein [Phaeosphaeriaceae sp. PMI808]